MKFIADNETFGELVVEETFVYFDGPRLFLAINATGQRYLVNCIDSTREGDMWLLAAVSDRRLQAIKSAELDLRDVFTHPEISAHLIHVSAIGALLSSSIPQSLSDDMLPLAGSFLEEALEAVAPTRSAPFLARTLNTNVLLLRLFPGTSVHEASAASVGKVLTAFSEYITKKLKDVYSRAQSLTSEVGDFMSTALPEVNVVGTFAGSLGVEFAVRGEVTLVRAALREAVDELLLIDEVDALIAQTSNITDKELAPMKNFLARMVDAKSDLSIETASVGDDVAVSATLPLVKVRRASRRLGTRLQAPVETTMEIVEGDLIGLNVRARTFELHLVAENLDLKGTVQPDVFNEGAQALLPSRYRMAIQGIRRTESGIETTGKLIVFSATKIEPDSPAQ